jgi:hypothetical protein
VEVGKAAAAMTCDWHHGRIGTSEKRAKMSLPLL